MTKAEYTEYNKCYYSKNRERLIVQTRKYRNKYRKERNEQKKKYYQQNKIHILEYQKKYRNNNRQKINKCCKKYRKKKMKEDLRYHITHNIRSAVNRLLHNRLKKKGKSTLDVLSYTIDELILHLEKQFQPNMSWNNYGFYGWHIDHIKPDSSFDYKSIEDEEFKKCWALKNLQPLWAEDNLKKGSKILYS